eukprot:8449768-Pyramimonas_sp.AAC.1
MTGCGLPPSLGGLTSLVEGLSYLGVVGVLGASAVTKVQTGSGLPTGRDGYVAKPRSRQIHHLTNKALGRRGYGALAKRNYTEEADRAYFLYLADRECRYII